MTTITVIDEPENPLVRAPLVEGPNDFASVTDQVARVAEGRTPKGWYLMFGISIALLLNLGAVIGYLVFTGVGVWGNNVPIGWGWPVTPAPSFRRSCSCSDRGGARRSTERPKP